MPTGTRFAAAALKPSQPLQPLIRVLQTVGNAPRKLTLRYCKLARRVYYGALVKIKKEFRITSRSKGTDYDHYDYQCFRRIWNSPNLFYAEPGAGPVHR